MLYLFTIFHRLNSGGVRLTNQEIRNCIYTGPFNDLLKSFDRTNLDWKSIKKRIWGSMERFRSTEVILRVLAFADERETYDGNLARFLNIYMHRHSNDDSETLAKLENDLKVLASKAKLVLSKEPQRKLPLLLVEALLVSMYTHRVHLAHMSDEYLAQAYKAMRAKPSFVVSARYAVTSVDNVKVRLIEAVESFSA